jgi:hypothetical protein
VQRKTSIRWKTRLWVIADYLQGKPFNLQSGALFRAQMLLLGGFHPDLEIFSRGQNLPRALLGCCMRALRLIGLAALTESANP